MLRFPSASNAQAILSPRFETINFDGKGELITCSRLRPCARADGAMSENSVARLIATILLSRRRYIQIPPQAWDHVLLAASAGGAAECGPGREPGIGNQS